MKTIFNKLMVDSPAALTAGIGRIINVFSETDIERVSVNENCYPRLFDISLLEKLSRCPVIISHHIDLSSVSELSHPAGLAIEVANKQDILEAAKFPPDLLIAKSFESSGVSKECSALILYQLLIKQDIPFSIHANTGLELFQAYLSAGVYGIVLPLKYLQDGTAPTLRFNLDTLTSLRLEVEGGPVNAHVYQQRLKEKRPLAFIAQTYQSGMWEKPLKPEKIQSIRKKLSIYKNISGYKTHYAKQSYFFPDSPAAQALKTSLPIVQGPMSGITVSADFAQEIYQQGAFPFLALAGLENDFVEEIVAETAQKNINFGVGIVAVSLSDEDFEQQIETFERYQPKLVLVGTPQLNHIERLLKTDLNIVVHAPNRALFKSLYQMGIRCFVIEGEEAGGHISNLGSLTAWQDIFTEIREQSLQGKVHIILAGGIKGKAAKDLISALLYYYGFENNLKISLQLGTAYLASKEAIALTPLSQGFQKQLLTVNDTLVSGESLSRRVRQLAIKNAEHNIAKEWRIFNSDKSHQDKKKQYEALYHGGLQRAIASDHVVENGSYMAGSVSALLDEQVTIKEIHADLIDPAPIADSSEQPEPIAIVGIGLKLPGAESVAEHFYNIFHQRCFITDLPEDHFNREIYLSADKEEELTSYTALGALINKLDDDLSHYRIPPIIATQLSRSQKMALDVAQKALEDANYFARPFNKARTGVIIGTGGGSNEDSLSKIDWPELRSRLMTLSEKEGINLEGILDQYESLFFSKTITADTRPGELANIIASRVASVFDFQGEAYTVDAACAASLAAIAHAMNSLRDRSCDVVLAGGVEERMGKETYIEFSRIGAVSENGCFGLDSKADGFVLGEGAAMFVLKRYSDALKFGDKIYAVFNGWGASSDGAGKGITAPNKEGQIQAVKRAYQNAQLSPSLVDYIECHATATKVGDSTELEGLLELFQHNTEKKPVLGASKTMVGHLRCGAGAVGVLQSLFVINNRRFPATINFQTPSSGNELPFTLLKQSKKVEHDDRIYSSVSAFGFGGTNFHLVLSSPEENIAEPVLSEQMMDLPVYQFSGDLAWVCPGQGSQYEGMLAAYKNDPEMTNLSGQIRSTFAEFSSIDLLALLTEIDADNQAKNEALLKSTETSQAAIFLTSVIIGKKLLNLGIRPDLLIGHSLGEYSALCLANILSFADAFRMVCIRGRLMSAAMVEDAGTMIAVMANETVAEKIIESTRHYAACANLNAYDQTVISCSEEAVKDILKAADKLKIRATQLKVARGFHSRFVSHCVDEMTKALQTCEFYYPDNLVTANIKNQTYPFDPERRRQVMSQADRQRSISLLKQQIDHPVHFINQIQAAYVSGIRRFIEVGPNNILSRLIEQIHQGKYLQTIYLNKQGEEGFDLDSLKTLLQQEIAIKRIPLPARQTTHKKAKPKAAASNAAAKYSAIDEIRHVVAKVSGYEPGSFDDNAEFERDLGIDTLKIFEILAQLRGKVLPEELGNFRELNSVNKILASCSVKDQAKETALSSPLDQIREIVAKVSGYPLHNLDDNAEFERDLGIDTLKIFEIIAQLRGTLLPDELTDFRNLNSIQKLYAARDRSYETAGRGEESKKELFVYKYKEHITEDYTLAAINLSDFEIHADNGWGHTVTDSKQHLLIFKVADSIKDLRHRVYPLLFTKTREFIQANSRQIIYLSYGTGPLQEASYLSISAFVRSVAKDFSQAVCHYNHFDRLPDESSIANHIIAGIGLKSATGSIMQGKLQKQHGFQTDLSQISTQLSVKDHIVVTGGARGIAAHLVKKLYANCQARFTLIGRKQPIEDWITKLDDQRIRYLAIDISDKAAVEKFKAQLADCTLLIHSAGLDYSKNFMQKTEQEFFAVIDAKVSGLFNLLEYLQPERVRALVLFSSTAAYWGNHGQTDYSMANAVLNSKIRDFPCLSLAWTAWDEVGMASRGIIHEILTTKGARFIGLDEGSDIFQNALASFLASSYASHSQLLITSKIPQDDFYFCPENKAIHSIDDLDKSIVTEFIYDSNKFPELLDHQFNGKIFVPGSVLLGTVLNEIDKITPLHDYYIEFDKVEFLSPLIVVDGVPNTLKITRNQNNYLLEEIKGELSLPIVKLSVSISAKGQLTDSLSIKDRYDATIDGLPIQEHQCHRRHSGLGESFQILETIALSQGIIQTSINLKSGNATLLQRLFAISKVFEACFQSCGTMAHLLKNADFIHLPSGLGNALVSFKALQKSTQLHCYVELLTQKPRDIYFNVLVVSEQGEPVMQIQDFTASPVFESQLTDSYLFQNTLLKDDFSESFIAAIDGLNQNFADSHCFTTAEIHEIDTLNSQKRKREKKAGKLACKILSNWASINSTTDYKYFVNTEVRSSNGPVQVLQNGEQVSKLPFYSISHSGSIVYVARAACPIGVDIERIRTLGEATINDIYGAQQPEIQKFVQDNHSNDHACLFPLIVFTQKEAALKAHGIGLSEGSDPAVIRQPSFNNALVEIKGQVYTVYTTIYDQYVVSKAYLFDTLPAQSIAAVIKRASRFQLPLLQEERRNRFSYSLNHVIEFNQTVDQQSLFAAINTIFEQHEVLRSRFIKDDSVLITPFVSQEFELENSTDSISHIEASFINEFSDYKYNLENEALYHIKLVQTTDGVTLLLMNFHHLILDCYNAFILSEAILQNYQRLSEGVPILPAMYAQYYDLEFTATGTQRTGFWTDYLNGVDIFQFDKVIIADDKHFKTISHINKPGLEHFCRSNSMTLFVGLLGALKLTFVKLYQKNDLVFFVPFSAKNSQNHHTLGSFIHLLPVRSKIANIDDYQSLFNTLKDNLYTAIEHQNDLIETSSIENNHGIIIQLINSGEDDEAFKTVKRRNTDGKNIHYPLILSFINCNDTLHLDVTFNADKVSAKQLDEILDCFQQELTSMINSVLLEKTTEVYTEPRSALETKLIGIWKEVFAIARVGIHDNFFDLGGHSLLAVVLQTKIKAKLNNNIPIEWVFQFPTVQLLAQAIENDDTYQKHNLDKIITPIQTTGTQAPFFWLNGGQAVPTMREHFSDQQPFYLLNHQSLDGQKAKYLSIPAMVDYYTQAITQIDSTGPYFLGGYSVGGLLIYEIAQQLCAQGKTVSMLFLLDPIGGEIDGNTNQSFMQENLDLSPQLNKYKKLRPALIFLKKCNRMKSRMNNKVKDMMVKAYFTMGKSLPTDLIWPYQLSFYTQASAGYQPKPPVAGIEKIILIQDRIANPELWASIVKQKYDIHVVDCNHLDLMKKPYSLEWIGILVKALF